MPFSDIQPLLNKLVITLIDRNINIITVTKIAEYLKDVPYISSIDLSSNPLLERGGIAVALLKAEGIGLAKTFITDVTVKKLLTNSNLFHLNIQGNRITTSAFDLSKDELNKCNIECLDLSYTQITDDIVKHLSLLPKLKILIANNTELTSSAIMNLIKISSLRYLEVQGCKLSNNEKKALKLFNKSYHNQTNEILQKQSIVSAPYFITKPPHTSCMIQ